MDPADELAARLGLPVADRALYERALVHGSFTNEQIKLLYDYRLVSYNGAVTIGVP
mgnify:CR=1 FL=1